MTYSTSNPPKAVSQGFGSAKTWWEYTSADDDATVNGANYISNGVALGMKLGDPVYVFDTATPKGSFHYVSAVGAAAVTLSFAAVA